MKVFEAATIKSRARAAAKALRALLAEKTLPKALRGQVEGLNSELGKTWANLEAEAADDPEKAEESMREAANIGEWIESRIHLRFTEYADDLFGSGKLTRDERIALSNAIGSALDAFNQTVAEKAPGLYQRPTWSEPDENGGNVSMTASDAGKVTKTEDGKQFYASDYAYVPDPQKPDGWKLRLTDTPGGASDAVHTGAAAAALGPNPPHGKGVQIPSSDLPAVKAKVRAAWKKAHPDAKPDELPSWLKESAAELELEGDYIPLVEAAVRRDGTVPLKIIAPGWGTTGYYAPEVLERDGPQVFTKGTKMFWNHPTVQEEAERPEGDLNSMAAELVNDARWDENGPAGAGLYADAKVFGQYKEAIDELAPHIGVSIRARGKGTFGQAEGRQGKLIQAITAAHSVDFVTSPGAGGQILQLFEARRSAAHISTNVQKGEKPMDEKELQALKEANAQLTTTVQEQATVIARLQERDTLREAGEFVAAELAAVELPQITKARLLQQLAANPPLKEGKLDRDAFKTQIGEAVKSEMAYLVEVTGAGRITGMGSNGNTGDPKPEEIEAGLKEAFGRIGLDEKVAEAAAKGR